MNYNLVKDNAKRILREKLRIQQQREANANSKESDNVNRTEVICSYSEVMENFTDRDKEHYGMNTTKYKKNFYDNNKHNAKIQFDKLTEEFTFIHIYK